MKILVSAYCCAPRGSSEKGFGWWWTTTCAERHEVTVVTCLAQKTQIEAYPASHPINIRFEYVSGPRKVSNSGTENRFERLHQLLWQLRAIPTVRRLIASGNFDLAQHVTIGTWRQPSCFAFSSIPYIFGPTSGSEKIPPGFVWHIGLMGALWEKTREALMALARWDPLVRRTLGRAARILTVGPATHAEMQFRYPNKTLATTRAYRKDIISARWQPREYPRNPSGPFVISWMGRLIPRKGLEILIQAVSDPRLADCVVEVIGDGPKYRRCARLATKLGSAQRIRFLGHMGQSQAMAKISASDLFAFTSLQDMMGQALSEAMQIGVPCVVLDWSGPSWLVGEDGAYKVAVNTYANTCNGLANAIVAIKKDGDLRRRLGVLAQRRIEYLTDPVRQAEEVDAIFQSVVRDGNPGTGTAVDARRSATRLPVPSKDPDMRESLRVEDRLRRDGPDA